MIDVRNELLALADIKNAEFESKLIPGHFKFLGVRLPFMRILAKRIAKDDWRSYLSNYELEYYEDRMLMGFIISYAKMSLDERLKYYKLFVPLINNWSICDSFCTTWKPLDTDRQKVWRFILPYLKTGEEFKMRFCAVMMLTHFIDEEHIDNIIIKLANAKHSGRYYKTGVAWAISTCFIKFPDLTFEYLKCKDIFDNETYKMIIRKICDSFRVTKEMKNRIRSL
ncbi:MAG: DNA alkylation repair protein [archaeon]|nr:DNA alkylation repair protein [archaeon]